MRSKLGKCTVEYLYARLSRATVGWPRSQTETRERVR